jgi:hypothetical protein
LCRHVSKPPTVVNLAFINFVAAIILMAKPPFQVAGLPYPSNLPFYQTEALSWLRNNKSKSALATNRFKTTEEAILAVKALYASGATRVDVVVTYCEPWRIASEGGHYAAELEVYFPRENVDRLLKTVKELHPDNWEADPEEDLYVDDGSYAGAAVTLSWD